MRTVRPVLLGLAIAICLAPRALSAAVVDSAIVGTWRCLQSNGYGPIYYAFGPDAKGTSHVPSEESIRLGFETRGDRLAFWPASNPRVISRLIYSVAGDILTERPDYASTSTLCARVSRNWMMPETKAGIPDFAVDEFIDVGVPTAQRAYIRKAMLAFPPEEREYVWGWDPTAKFFSNRLPDYMAMERGTDGFFSGRRGAIDRAIIGSWQCGDARVRYRSDGTGRRMDRQGTWNFVFATRGTTVMQHDAASGLGIYGQLLEEYSFTPRGGKIAFDGYRYWREGDGWTVPSSRVALECRRD